MKKITSITQKDQQHHKPIVVVKEFIRYYILKKGDSIALLATKRSLFKMKNHSFKIINRHKATFPYDNPRIIITKLYGKPVRESFPLIRLNNEVTHKYFGKICKAMDKRIKMRRK